MSFNLGDYEVVNDEARLSTEFLIKVSNRLGNPEEVSGETSWKLMDAIVSVWADSYPQEFHNMKEQLEEEIKYQRPIRQAIKEDGGQVLVAFPPKLFQMMRVFFTKQKFSDKKFCTAFAKRYPALRGTGYKI